MEGKKTGFAILSVILFCFSLTACSNQKATMPVTSASIAIPFTTKRQDPLTCPVIGKNPSQAESGSYVYCQVCMVCHGDVGQGLTAWQNVLQPPDNNCLQSGCHGKKHPPEGFYMYEIAPPIIGKGILDHYGTALNLHEYLVKNMPWWNPGYLKPVEYWQLTAFLLEANGIDPGKEPLNEGNAGNIKIVTQ